MGILDGTVDIEEIALPSSLVQEIEALLPVQRCHSEEDFQMILSLYSREGWNCISPDWMDLTQKYFSHYHPEEWIILWCTHYPYLQKPLQGIFPDCKIIDPSEESAKSLDRYIKKHKVPLQMDWKILFL